MLEFARELDDTDLTVDALAGTARQALRDGDLARVRALAEECLELGRRTGIQRAVERPLHFLAEAARLGGDLGAARGYYEAGLAASRAGDGRMVAAEQYNLACVELAEGNVERASVLRRESLTSGPGADP